ncbi:MAG: hypothetical protein AB3N16_08020 [Flavobacteriaceae bacterium]
MEKKQKAALKRFARSLENFLMIWQRSESPDKEETYEKALDELVDRFLPIILEGGDGH